MFFTVLFILGLILATENMLSVVLHGTMDAIIGTLKGTEKLQRKMVFWRSIQFICLAGAIICAYSGY